MARVTVEDCILNVPNRFELVLLASQRAKQIASGNPLTLPRDNDKDAVVALREIADRTVSLDQLQEETVQSFCRKSAPETVDQTPAEATQGAVSGEVAQEFSEAGQHISETKGDEAPAGLSFASENIDVED